LPKREYAYVASRKLHAYVKLRQKYFGFLLWKKVQLRSVLAERCVLIRIEHEKKIQRMRKIIQSRGEVGKRQKDVLRTEQGMTMEISQD
jgi:hypothetical protein